MSPLGVSMTRAPSRVQGDPVHGVHRRVPDEARHEQVGRVVVDLAGRCHLLDHALVHHRHPMTHRHPLDLVVGHVDDGRGEPSLELDELGTRLGAELGVEIRERLVHEERLGLPDDRPRQCDPLALATGHLGRPAIEHLGQLESLGHLLDLPGPLVLRHPLVLERELDVAPGRHLRVQRVALEDHRHVALLGLDVVDDPVTDLDGPLGRMLEPGDEPQHRRLPATGRPEQDEELTVLDLERDVAYRLHVAESLRDLLERHQAHQATMAVAARAL